MDTHTLLIFLYQFLLAQTTAYRCTNTKLEYVDRVLKTTNILDSAVEHPLETIALFPTNVLTTCVQECMLRSGCLSVNYDTSLGNCELLPFDTTSHKLEIATGYIYSEMTDWPRVRKNEKGLVMGGCRAVVYPLSRVFFLISSISLNHSISETTIVTSTIYKICLK